MPLVHEVVARNDAVESENAIHHDGEAQRYGFRGGLVPGVTVYGYLCWAPGTQWGRAWLERGTISARFVNPVYDDDRVSVRATAVDDSTLELVAVTADGRICATGTATLPAERAPLPSLEGFPTSPVPAPDERPPATAEVLAKVELGTVSRVWDAPTRAGVLELLGDDVTIYQEADLAHPGGLIRAANDVLWRSVRLGPWIHVASATTHHGVVPGGSTVVTRGRVAEVYERKGHRFVELDVVAAVGDAPVLSTRHVAIYEPRRKDAG